MPFYKSVWKFIFPIHGICFLTDPAIAIFVHGIFSEPSKKNMIHSETRRITTNFPKVPLTRI